SDFLDEEVEQRRGRDVADGLFHVLPEVALDRVHGLAAHVLRQFDRHRWISAAAATDSWLEAGHPLTARITRQGLPAANTSSGTSRVTTLPAPITEREPMRTPP